MNPEIHSVLQEMVKHDTKLGITTSDRDAHLSVCMARLLVLLAEEAENNATKAEKATKRIVVLTWIIAILTAFLVLTAFFNFPKFAI